MSDTDQLILTSLERIEGKLDKTVDLVSDHAVEIAVLKTNQENSAKMSGKAVAFISAIVSGVITTVVAIFLKG